MQRTLIVGAGIFGLSTALALRAKGHAVQVLDPGPVPHPLASSTDLSKVIRPDYGADALYTDWMLEALPRWQAWSDRLSRPLYHRTGVAFLAEGPASRGRSRPTAPGCWPSGAWPSRRWTPPPSPPGSRSGGRGAFGAGTSTATAGGSRRGGGGSPGGRGGARGGPHRGRAGRPGGP
ncbi:MAG: FAD-dependent oxidoreductase [bacterium]